MSSQTSLVFHCDASYDVPLFHVNQSESLAVIQIDMNNPKTSHFAKCKILLI